MCHDYWPPLYAFARRMGRSPHDAEDLTQSFFAALIEKNTLAAAEQARGKLRTFLLAAFQHHVADAAKREHAVKRGGGAETLSIEAEEWFACEPAERETPETIYDRTWAVTVIDGALDALRAEYSASDKSALFDELSLFLTGDRGPSYAEIASRLNMTEGNVKVGVHRLRQRYRELLRSSVANTVANPRDVDEELHHLFRSLNR